ncbi:ankyrin repeats (3 copies) domain-containing protein [Pochonia chlamydosporia 170]|uniref:Ankyrin repeats (3 copies) domain-containing protein n=1 Tax=Pochonia chlamydosporia 170 TaxID=1380566 RepID=A0A179F250_METCM|nr:ankyrin repeats (3 copies) domain-containing protein [Pochonia chlamydosporia 170]OAQ59451.1 ankyrin repeats (3 copies) domain-containing protein [Pochonia chlamydosporia 170]
MLHLGIARGGPDISRQVVVAAQPSDFTLNNMSGCNPLMTLVDRGFSDLFALFLSKGPAPAIDLLEKQILSYAVASGKESIALQILRIRGFQARLGAGDGEDLLLSASATGLKSVVKELLLCYSSRNAVNVDNLNALQLAAQSNQFQMIRLLLDFEVCPRGDRHGDFGTFRRLYSHESYSGIMLDMESLLHCAVQGRNQALIEIILELTTYPDYKRLLKAAAQYDVLDTVQLSIERIPNFEAQFSLGHLLILAARHNSSSVVTFLLSKYSIDPNFTDSARRTALWYAVSGCCIPIISFLLTRDDLDPNIPDDTGCSPLRLAAVQRDPSHDILELLALDSRIIPAYQNQGIAATSAIRKQRDYQLLKRLRRRGFIDVGFRGRKRKVKNLN